MRAIAIELGGYTSSVRQLVMRTGGIAPPLVRKRSSRFLSLAEIETAIRARRPEASKLALNPTLRDMVETKLEERWSPQQISVRFTWLVVHAAHNGSSSAMAP